jgi:hypothetical protein
VETETSKVVLVKALAWGRGLGCVVAWVGQRQ